MIENENIILSVILPVYNEEIAVIPTLTELETVVKSLGVSYEIIAVNDASTDKSSQLISKFNGIKVINHPYNLGYGASIKSGLKQAIGKYILITDADGTYPIDAIPGLFSHINKYDMVVGARIGEKVNIPFMRRPAKRFITLLANILIGRKIPDLNSGLRIFRKNLADEFFHLFPQRFSLTTTITLAFLSEGYTVKYVPIDYHKRSGKSSIRPFSDFLSFLALIVRVMVYFRPFKMFTLLSLLLIMFAIFVALSSMFFLHRLMDTSFIVIILTSIQVFVSGLVAELIVKTRR